MSLEPPPVVRLRSRIGSGQYTPLRVPNLSPPISRFPSTTGPAGPDSPARVAAAAALPNTAALLGTPDLATRRNATADLQESRQDILEAIDAFVENRKRTNVFTQLWEMKPFTYLVNIFIFGFLGIIAGVGVEALIDLIPNNQDNSGTCVGILMLQIFYDAVLILLLSLFLGLYVDKIIVHSWSGFLFGVTFFVGQTSLVDNCRCAFRMAIK